MNDQEIDLDEIVKEVMIVLKRRAFLKQEEVQEYLLKVIPVVDTDEKN